MVKCAGSHVPDLWIDKTHSTLTKSLMSPPSFMNHRLLECPGHRAGPPAVLAIPNRYLWYYNINVHGWCVGISCAMCSQPSITFPMFLILIVFPLVSQSWTVGTLANGSVWLSFAGLQTELMSGYWLSSVDISSSDASAIHLAKPSLHRHLNLVAVWFCR